MFLRRLWLDVNTDKGLSTFMIWQIRAQLFKGIFSSSVTTGGRQVNDAKNMWNSLVIFVYSYSLLNFLLISGFSWFLSKDSEIQRKQ